MGIPRRAARSLANPLRACLVGGAMLAAASVTPGRAMAGEQPSSPADPIWNLLPEDVVAGVVIEDVASLREAIRSYPHARPLVEQLAGTDMGDEDIRGFLRSLPVSENDALSFLWDRAIPRITPAVRGVLRDGPRQLNTTAAELLRAFDGPLLVYTSGYEAGIRGGRFRGEWNVVLCARVTPENRDRAWYLAERLMERHPTDANASRPDMGSTGPEWYHLEQAMVEGHLLVGVGQEGLLAPVVARLREAGGTGAGAGAPLAALAGPDADAVFFFHQDRYYPKRMGAMGRAFSDPWPIILGVSGAGPLVASVSFRPEALSFRAHQGGLEPGEGLLGMMAAMPDNDFRELRRVLPAASAFATVSFNLRDIYTGYRDAMVRTDPAHQFTVDSVIRIVQTIINMDIQDDLFAHYEGQLVTYARPPEDDDPGHALFYIPAREGSDRTDQFHHILRSLSGERVSFFKLNAEDHEGITVWRTPPTVGSQPNRDRLSMAATAAGIVISDLPEEAAQLAVRLAGAGSGEASAPPVLPPRVAELLAAHSRPTVKGLGYVSGEAAAAEFAARFAMAGQPDGAAPPRVEHLWWVAEGTGDSVRFTFTVESEVPSPP